MTKIGLLHTTIRVDEKLLMQAAKSRAIELDLIDVRKQVFDPVRYEKRYDVAIDRCISTTLGMHSITFFENIGIPTVNSSTVANICIDKFATSMCLQKNNVRTVPFAMTFTEDGAKKAVNDLGGYPVVIKPPVGSWGRLLAKINDDDALEAIIEQKQVLGSPLHKAFYIQKFMQKPERDIRVTMVGGKVLCAIYRSSKHWITNTARGAKAKKCRVTREMQDICSAASSSVGGGVLGIDLFETDEGYLVNEINHTTEFKNVQKVTGVDIAGAILDYSQGVAEND